MAAPTSFPVFLSMAGAPDAVANDVLSYNLLIAAGYGFRSATPDTMTMIAGLPGQIIETPISVTQPDTVPGDQDNLS